MAIVPEESSITDLLQRWSTGDLLALEALIPLVHGELHTLADRYLQRESHEATAPRMARKLDPPGACQEL